jgi:hypothetical protein
MGQKAIFPQEECTVKRKLVILCGGALALIAVSAFIFSSAKSEAAISGAIDYAAGYAGGPDQRAIANRSFDVQILVNGRSLEEYEARGKSYVEAIPGAEYEVRIRNPLPYHVAVALSVDGLNTIDAQHTTAWNASKWVIEPYGTISINGWQMSSVRARRFYFTSERDSYGAKLGQTSNLGVVTAVFFRELRPYPVPVTPAPRPHPIYEEDGRDRSSEAPDSSGESAGRADSADSKSANSSVRKGQIRPQPDDEYAATGIGRSVQNDVRWVNMELDSRAAGEVTIRYEYYPALVRLGIMPRRYYERPDTLSRREGARGFEDRRFSREP